MNAEDRVTLYHNPGLGSIDRWGSLLDTRGEEIPFRIEIDRRTNGVLTIPYVPGLWQVNGWNITAFERKGVWSMNAEDRFYAIRVDPPPPPERIVVSERAGTAYFDAAYVASSQIQPASAAGLRAAFKVMLEDNLAKLPTEAVLRLQGHINIGGTRTGLYRELTGEEWPG